MVRPTRTRRSLVGRFAVSSLVIFIVTGLAVSWVMIRDVRSGAEAQAVFHARFATRAVLAPALTAADLASPLQGDRYAQLRALVERRILSDGNDVRIKIWSGDGVVLFSDER